MRIGRLIFPALAKAGNTPPETGRRPIIRLQFRRDAVMCLI